MWDLIFVLSRTQNLVSSLKGEHGVCFLLLCLFVGITFKTGHSTIAYSK